MSPINIETIDQLKNPFARQLAKMYRVAPFQFLPGYLRFRETFLSKPDFLKSKEVAENLDFYLGTAACQCIVSLEFIEHDLPVCFPTDIYTHFAHNKITGLKILLELALFQTARSRFKKEEYIKHGEIALRVILLLEKSYRYRGPEYRRIRRIYGAFRRTYQALLPERVKVTGRNQ